MFTWLLHLLSFAKIFVCRAWRSLVSRRNRWREWESAYKMSYQWIKISNNWWLFANFDDYLQLISGRFLNAANYLSAVIDMYTIHTLYNYIWYMLLEGRHVSRYTLLVEIHCWNSMCTIEYVIVLLVLQYKFHFFSRWFVYKGLHILPVQESL